MIILLSIGYTHLYTNKYYIYIISLKHIVYIYIIYICWRFLMKFKLFSLFLFVTISHYPSRPRPRVFILYFHEFNIFHPSSCYIYIHIEYIENAGNGGPRSGWWMTPRLSHSGQSNKPCTAIFHGFSLLH